MEKEEKKAADEEMRESLSINIDCGLQVPLKDADGGSDQPTFRTRPQSFCTTDPRRYSIQAPNQFAVSLVHLSFFYYYFIFSCYRRNSGRNNFFFKYN
jgi:hypothetical protein